MTCQLDDHEFAVHLVYLVAGIERKLALHRTTDRLLGTDTSHPLTESGGHVGMVIELVPKAKLIADLLAEYVELHPGFGSPGVFEYDVTEELGLWYADNPESTDDEFAAQLAAMTAAFFSRYIPYSPT